MSLNATIKARIRHTPFFPLLRRRRFHAYSLGAPKTGTTSIAFLFEQCYSAAHEPLHAGTMEHILGVLRGERSRNEIKRYLRWRDRELYLEMESSHPTAVFVDVLAGLFPRSKFILTVRDPRSWLDSIVNQQLNGRLQRAQAASLGPRAAFFPALHDIVCKAGTRSFAPGERVLQEHDLYSLDGYLSWWADHNRAVLEAVPPARLLIVRTERLSRDVSRIAEFLGVPVDTLAEGRRHSNEAPRRHGIVDRIDPDLLADRIAHHCSAVCGLLEEAQPGCTAGMLIGDEARASSGSGDE